MMLPQDDPELAARLSGAQTAEDACLDASYTRFRLLEAIHEINKGLSEAAAILEGLSHDLEGLVEAVRGKE